MPRLHEARFGFEGPIPLVYREVEFEPPVVGERRLLRDRASFDSDDHYQAYLSHELEAAQGRGDQPVIDAAKEALAG
jgi:hypothetical protein